MPPPHNLLGYVKFDLCLIQIMIQLDMDLMGDFLSLSPFWPPFSPLWTHCMEYKYCFIKLWLIVLRNNYIVISYKIFLK